MADGADIDSGQIRIALEPEAASIYCRQLPVDASTNEREQAISNLPIGTKYMVLDAEVNEVQESNTLREERAANGGAWGGTIVNKAFEDFLTEIFGDTVFESFKMKETEDWLYMALQFEEKKREIEIKSPRYTTLRLPVSMIELCERLSGIQIQDAVAASKYAELVDIVRDKLKLSTVVFFYMFGQTLQRTVDHVKSLFIDKTIREVGIILMVVGFSESQLLQQALKEAFPNKEIVVPLNPSSCVLRGALMYDHTPLTINGRILKYTYGVNAYTKFKEDSLSFFQQSNCDGATILTFYKLSYSADEEKKAKETMVVFNFWKFLKKTERGCISTVCVNQDYWTESDTVLTLEHILQAFLGYEALPTDINSGIIEFDYEMDAIS
ncbi:heat shock 70 kDa protein 12A-like [Ruditapes philippinarum]|uniref:heat shock 70 kDa protein 12A-like n=1 Tax=Ruditapes philippinarum TaxID=129788 RepID=UPI00295B4EB7|nr:heat shock 70 kDa protein 12A-like [Ruditapes philippinarum]